MPPYYVFGVEKYWQYEGCSLWVNQRQSETTRASSRVVAKTFFGLETKTETLEFRSRDRDHDLDKMNSSALESQDNGLEITSLTASIPIGDRALA